MELAVQYYRGGVYLPALDLWLDSHEPQGGSARVFISHAHSDHLGDHREVIVSAPTARLFQARMPGQRIEHVLAWGERKGFVGPGGGWEIVLWPAGHILGSAMAEVRVEGCRLAYTGDFKLRHGLSAEPCDPERIRGVDILIMETTFGRPQYTFPPTRDVLHGVIRFCREAIDNDEVPVLLGYSLGKSQELLHGLAAAGLLVCLHEQIHRLTLIYEELGQVFPPFNKLAGKLEPGCVVLCPPMGNLPAAVRGAGRLRTAVLTGWAVDSACKYRYGADAAFPLSDHADFPDLVKFVERVGPKRIYTLHGFAADFAGTLRDRGYDARALSETEQLGLGLTDRSTGGDPVLAAAVVRGSASVVAGNAGWSGGSQWAPGNGSQTVGPGMLIAFAEVCGAVGGARGKLEKVRLVSDYLRLLEGDRLAHVTVWLTGMPFPPAVRRVLGLGWAVIRDAVCSAADIARAELQVVYLKHSDLGETAAELLSVDRPTSPGLSVDEVSALFDALAVAKGPTAKVPLLAAALNRCQVAEARYLVKILTGDLRIGLKEGLVEEAVAMAFGVPADEIRRANLLLGDPGEAARYAAEGRLSTVGLVPFRPVKFMLASPEESAEAIWKRMTDGGGGVGDLSARPATEVPAGVWVEDKYDGVRCQLHKVGDRVELYSRDLKEVTETFYEIAAAARAIPTDVVLDGEILGMRGDRVLPFADLQKRLGRREADLFLNEEIPVRYAVFDLLWCAGETWMDRTLRERRQRLAGLGQLPSAIWLAPVHGAASAGAIDECFDAARARGNEGLLIKAPESFYSPGRRGLAWLKLKKAFATLDCVVVWAEYGHGKRRGVLSDYTFAVLDEETGELKTIGKAFTGLTDLEIGQLTRHFLAHTRERSGRYLEVEPDTVLEIAFDSIRPSSRHTSGLALRFPRIVRIRTDKGPGEIDTLAHARRLVS